MTPKQLLIDALRSGEFKQICFSLKDRRGCCALGVAVEVYLRNRTVDMVPLAQVKAPFFGDANDDTGVVRFLDGEDQYDGSLPIPVREWYGTDSAGALRDTVVAKNGFSYTRLVDLNDRASMTFAEIADVLEHNEFTIPTLETV